MKRILLIFSVLSIVVLSSACSGKSNNPNPDITSTTAKANQFSPTETAKPDPTASPAPSDPRDPTSNLLVNATINQLLDLDIEALMSKIQIIDVPCTTADGLGGPPKCSEGVEDGTVVSIFPVLGPGEGSHFEPDEVERIFDYQNPQLYQVILIKPAEIPDEVYPEGSYAVIMAIEPDSFARTFRLNEEGFIVRVDYTAWSPYQEAEKINGEILFNQ